ncbi:serine--tRNA ligase [Candidatus Marinimicrobia bacterium]|nr:serine--tRNA ligase [Candidatus Neomarinimicrobiota bacterium]MDA9656448.1 serine--tRNA ligase [Candidatus Neomarinimicrobiota bacterium]
MISIKKIRENPEEIISKLRSRNDKTDIKEVLLLDDKIRTLKTRSSEYRAQRNIASENIGKIKKEGGDSIFAIKETRDLGNKLKELELDLIKNENELKRILFQMPNVPQDSVPVASDFSGNVTLREWGNKREYNFKLKNHIQLGEDLNLFDFKRGSKLSGSGFPLYVGNGAKLERSLINSMIDHHVTNFSFTEMLPSILMKKESMETTGQLPKFQEDMYHTEIDNLYLAPTAEVPITNLHRDEILNESDLPIKYVGYTPCFRRESGSYGKDTRGLLRVHQFNKVELVEFIQPDDSIKELERLTLQAESVLQKLGLHYRVIELCTGDLGFSASKCYDIELWAPAEQQWLEVSSCSSFDSFQSRRGNIRFRRKKDKKVDFVHTLNGSGVATPRLMVALIETYQEEDGIVRFPEKVSSFLGIKELA